MTDVFDQVVDIISKHSSADRKTFASETRLEDINIESLDLVEIMFEIEEKFKIEVPSNPNAESRLEFSTIGEVVEGVNAILAKKAS